MNHSLNKFLAAFFASVLVVFAWLAARAPDRTNDIAVRTNSQIAELRDRVQSNLRSALMDADTSPDDTRSGVTDELARDWALTNSEEFLAYVESQDRLDHLVAGLVAALVVMSKQILEIATRYPSVQAGPERTLEELATTAVAERDLTAALTHLDTLPSGDRHQRIRRAIAETWARQNPREALQWAEGLEPPAPDAIAKVIASTAESDVDTAIGFFEAFEVPPWNHPSMQSGVARPVTIAESIVRQITSNSERVRVADDLLQRRTERTMVALQTLTSHWSRVDEPAATEWVARNAERLPDEMPAGVVRALAAKDAAAAASFVDRLPAGMRVSLAEPIVRGLARVDPFSAANWIEQFKERPEYSQLYVVVVRSLMRSDPASAAALLSSTPPAAPVTYVTGQERRMEGDIAEIWARQDPVAASDWARSIADPAGRAAAVNSLTLSWLASDPERAQRFVLGLPQDEIRQEALSNLIGWAITYGHDLESETVRNYAVNVEQQQTIGRMLETGAFFDPLRARSLAREWLSEPEIRQATIDSIVADLNRYSTTEAHSN